VLEEDLRREYYSSPRVSSSANIHMRSSAEVRREGSGAASLIPTSAQGPPVTRISGIRERIARRMRESLASTAQYTLNTSADAGQLLTLRARIKASAGVLDLNINDLVTFCTI
jgi:pyruvate/2-oxoglutarate dehydrogenase complex dihydrolipoamide acyltransferase (E2) component